MAIISGNYSPFHKSSKKSSTPPKEMALMHVYVLCLSLLGDMRSRLLLDKAGTIMALLIVFFFNHVLFHIYLISSDLEQSCQSYVKRGLFN